MQETATSTTDAAETGAAAAVSAVALTRTYGTGVVYLRYKRR